MTAEQLSAYLADHPQGNIPAVEMRHLVDPLDYDGGPLQALAPHAASAPVPVTSQALHSAV